MQSNYAKDPRVMSQLDRAKKQVKDVTIIMQDNFVNLIKREDCLKDLETRAEKLSHGAKLFSRSSDTVFRKRVWWKQYFEPVYVAVLIFFIVLLSTAFYDYKISKNT